MGGISETTRPNIAKIPVHITTGRCSVFRRRRLDCTSGFTNVSVSLMFAHNQPGSGNATRVGSLLKMTHQGHHGFDAASHSAAAAPGAESDRSPRLRAILRLSDVRHGSWRDAAAPAAADCCVNCICRLKDHLVSFECQSPGDATASSCSHYIIDTRRCSSHNRG